MKKNIFNNLVMVLVVMVLILTAPACKTQESEPGLDDIQFVSLTVQIVNQYDGFADVSSESIGKFKTFAPTRVFGNIYAGSLNIGEYTVDLPSTDGQWVSKSMPTSKSGLPRGVYETRLELILESNGKMVTGAGNPITVK